MTIAMIRRRKAGLGTQGQSPVSQYPVRQCPVRQYPGTLSGQELRRLVADMVD